jgi:branched-chain amino acid transport system ATP-binding protein
MTLLSVENVDASHGLLRAVRDVSLHVEEGEVLALVGANGAGKTTLLRTISGAHRADRGRILFDQNDVTWVATHRRARMGIGLVPEGRRLFPGLTVEENLLVAGRYAREGAWSVDAVLEAFPLLRPLRSTRASALSGGEQQATAIGRALMTNPRLLLLDEVSLGLAPQAVDAVYRSIDTLIGGGATVLLVEQDLSRAMSVAHRIACMLEGSVVLEGLPGDLSREQVTEAYFGLERQAPADPVAL